MFERVCRSQVICVLSAGHSEDENESENEHMQPPSGVLPAHHEDVVGGFNDSGTDEEKEEDNISSGVSEAGTVDDELCDDLQGEEVQKDGETEPQATTAQHHTSRVKKFHLSQEWKRLEKLSEQNKIPYTLLPAMQGLGIHRHPSGNFWSARCPGEPWFTCKWSDERPPFVCLLKILRHAIKLYIKSGPVDTHKWTAHLEELGKLSAESGES